MRTATTTLPDGDYSYSVSCSGYKTVRGEFTVSGKDLTVDGIQLEIQTSWDGESYTEPAKNGQGVYLICSPDELMWFDKNAKMTDSAKLLADITINEDVSGSDATSQKYKWTPIGTDSSKYTGTFDRKWTYHFGIIHQQYGCQYGYVWTYRQQCRCEESYAGR